MIECFYGTIEVTPRGTQFEKFTVTAKFVYDEKYDAWHGNNNYYKLDQSKIIEIKEVFK